MRFSAKLGCSGPLAVRRKVKGGRRADTTIGNRGWSYHSEGEFTQAERVCAEKEARLPSPVEVKRDEATILRSSVGEAIKASSLFPIFVWTNALSDGRARYPIAMQFDDMDHIFRETVGFERTGHRGGILCVKE